MMFTFMLLVGLVCGLSALLAFALHAWVWACVTTALSVFGFIYAFRAVYGESRH